MAKASEAFKRAYQHQQGILATEQAIRDGGLVRVPGTDAVMPSGEYDAFVQELQMDGLAIADGTKKKQVVAEVFVPGSTTHSVRVYQLG